jgi:hypothetical protein
MMNDPASCARRPAGRILAEGRFLKVAVVTAKDKLRTLLGHA